MKKYLVLHKQGGIFSCTLEQIDHDNDKGADFKFLKVDDKGRIYVCEEDYNVYDKEQFDSKDFID